MNAEFSEMLWAPTKKKIAETHMTLFQNFVNSKKNIGLSTWEELYNWSIEDPQSFWTLVGEYTNITWIKKSKSPHIPPPRGKMRGAKWFPGSKLNFSENLINNLELEKKVLISYREERKKSSLTGKELINRVAKLAYQLKEIGFKKGDKAFGVLNNGSSAVEIMLAVTSIGGVYSSCSPDFGSYALLERIKLVDPQIIFCEPSTLYMGKETSCIRSILKCQEALSANKKFILISSKKRQTEKNSFKNSYDYEELIKKSKLKKQENSETYPIKFEAMDFHDPLYIMFSSGTTGTPKCIVHGVGGTLIQHKKELMLHCDLKKNDKIMFYTTCSWMMWNWVTSSLAVGASLVLYEGSPSYPEPSSYWKVCEKENVQILGTSPSYIGYSQNKNIHMKKKEAFKGLKCILSTGAPLLPKHFSWVYKEIKTDVHLASISGGTDIISCFVLGNPNLPVYSGEIQVPGLGMKVEAKKEGEEGEKAELTCTKAFISMPLYFLNDPKGERLKQSYFRYDKNQREIWKHGDYIQKTKNAGIIIHGRSDATLNPNGVRIGTSEIYNALESVEDVLDSLAVAKETNIGEKVVLFVQLKPNLKLSSVLEEKIKQAIQNSLTKRHVPKKIIQIQEIPYTHSGKKVELAVKKLLNGEKVNNKNSLRNPLSLDEYSSFNNINL